MDEEEEEGRERSSTQVPLSVFSASQVTQNPRVKNTKSIGNLNGMWLQTGTASLLDVFPPNSKSLSLPKHSNCFLH
jgi:hypothetical protein